MPLVSCIMPTRNHRAFVSQAVAYFLRQDYPQRELIVVDDGEDAIGDLLPRESRIRYIRLERRAYPSQIRTIALEASRGDLLAHWSDVDWIGARRLSCQVRALASSGADVCGLGRLLHYCLEEGQAWLYAPPGPRSWLAEATLLYQRTAWAAGAPSGMVPGQHSSSIRHAPATRTSALGDHSCYIAVVLPADRGLIEPRDPSWQRRAVQEVNGLMAGDQHFYVGLRHGLPAVSSGSPVTSVTLAAPFFVYDGIGSMAEYLALGMARAGARLNIVPFRLDTAGISPELERLLARSRPDPSAPALCFSWLGENLSPFSSSDSLFINTMWETSRLPARFIAKLQQARAIIVPSRAVAGIFRESGVTAPIEVVAQGVDPAVYPFLERPEREGLTTLMVGSFTPRKNFTEGIAAWKKAFAIDSQARLIIKSRFGYHRYVPDDPRITFVDSEETTRGIAHWYGMADILMALGNEGFGLPLVEGMATGLPVVALDADGQADVCQAAGACLRKVRPARYEPFDEPSLGSCGVRGVPSVDDIASQLRWVACHRQEARAMGRAASAWVHEHRDVWKMGPAVLEVMEAFLGSTRPIRRWITIWAAPNGRSSRFVEDLSRHLPAIHVTERPPDLHTVRLLHVQFEEGLFDEEQVACCMRQARHAGIPIVVAESQAGTGARAWEHEATVLAAPTRTEAEQLRARWPHKRVELLPACDWPQATQSYLSLWEALDQH